METLKYLVINIAFILDGLPSSDLDGGNKYSIKYYRDNIYKSLSHHRIKEL